MKTSKVLKLAKTYLAASHCEMRNNYKEEYICYSVNDVYLNHHKCSIDDRNRVKDMIANRLGDYCTLDDWLESLHNIVHPDWDEAKSKMDAFVDKMQKTRHAWVDSMIAEFAAKGD